MKVILSRKGFDSDNGGYPSPILPNGEMVSLPIPSSNKIHYSDIRTDKSTCYDLMKDLKPKIKYNDKWKTLSKNTRCHLDPDIYKNAITRESGWKPCFGPSVSAQTHLKNQDVKEDDLFLFFGWFKRTRTQNNIRSFYKDDSYKDGFHAIFGYFQIGEIKKLDTIPKWMTYHPHATKGSTIHIARDKLSWNNSIPGAGRFGFDNKLILTKKGCSRSKWDLPFGKVKISHHDEDSWKDGYFQSATIGQEFVIEDNEDVENWAKSFIKQDPPRR